MTASPAKLRNGSWGARVLTSHITAGDTITITARNGKTWDATVDRVLWTGTDRRTGQPAALVSTRTRHSSTRPTSRRWADVDHEDCLSFAGCVHGSRYCDYH